MKNPVSSAALLLVLFSYLTPYTVGPVVGEEAAAFETAQGWEWAVEPVPGRTWSSGGILALIDENRDGDLLVTLGHAPAFDPMAPIYRPVVFDTQGARFDLRGGGGIGSGDMAMSRFLLEHTVLPPERVHVVGVEILLFEGRRAISAREAAVAADRGISVLPFPEVGKPFEFSLSGPDGEQILSQELRGRVVVVDCWATWCRPCMAKMSKLKALAAELGSSNVALVGVNFDIQSTKAQAAVDSLHLSWPQVFVPADDVVRRFWHDVATVRSLPRLFVIDRDGLLVGDIRPQELGDLLRSTIGRD